MSENKNTLEWEKEFDKLDFIAIDEISRATFIDGEKVKSFIRQTLSLQKQELETEYLNKLQELDNQKYEGVKEQIKQELETKYAISCARHEKEARAEERQELEQLLIEKVEGRRSVVGSPSEEMLLDDILSIIKQL